MPRKPIKFNLDFMKKDIFEKFTLKQFDDATFTITPLMNGEAYDTTEMTGKIYVGINGEMFLQDTNITVSSNSIVVTLDRNMLSKFGRAYAEIELTDSTGTVTSSSFIFKIDAKIGEGATIPGSIDGFIAKYEKLIAEFKNQVDNAVLDSENRTTDAINNVNVNLDNKINDIEIRFQKLTTSQQQSAEVIDARTDIKGKVHISLKDRLDNISDELVIEKTETSNSTDKGYVVCENTNNGQIEELKLEGKTLVNLCPKLAQRYNECNLSSEKGFTVITSIQGFTENLMIRTLSQTDQPQYNSVIRGEGYAVKYFSYQSHKQITRVYFDNSAPSDFSKIKVIILEGDYTQNPPSYFEGLKSVGDGVDKIEVLSCPKYNLLKNYTKYTNGYYVSFDSGNLVGSASFSATDFVDVEGGKYLRCINSNKSIAFYDKNNKFVASKSPEGTDLDFIIEVPINAKYVRMSVAINNQTFAKAILLQEDKKTPYPSNKKQILYQTKEGNYEKPILRSIGGVSDIIEKQSDGKYYFHKRYGEVVWNGSESIAMRSEATQANTLLFEFRDSSMARMSPLYCDKLPTYTSDLWSVDFEGVRVYHNSDKVHVRILKTRLSSQDLEGFKTWLQSNPVTVVYQLATEEVYECVNLDLDSYEGETSVMFDGGAISPKITFKIASHIGNIISVLKDRINYLENKVITMFKAVLSGDVQTLAYELYPEDFEKVEATEENIETIEGTMLLKNI